MGRAVPHSPVLPGVGEAEGRGRETVRTRVLDPEVGMGSTGCWRAIWSLRDRNWTQSLGFPGNPGWEA